MEFCSPNPSDLENLQRILKRKLNFLGFHDSFKGIKKIGSGNFASVKKSLKQNLKILGLFSQKQHLPKRLCCQNNEKTSFAKKKKWHSNNQLIYSSFKNQIFFFIKLDWFSK